MSQADRAVVLFLVLVFSQIVLVASAVDCATKHRSNCPQSTFQTEQDKKWKCPSFWQTAKFTSTRWEDDLKPVDTTNLTAHVAHTANETSIDLCSFTETKDDSQGEWPSGTYCVPAPHDKPCPATMNTVTANVSAPGRMFRCDGALPMFNCNNGTFQINACCPENTTVTGYLDVPMYEIEAFYLLKTHETCPKLYSFTSTEESIVMDNATASGEHGEYFLNVTDGNLRISFCRYTNVTCTSPTLVAPYEGLDVPDNCKRFENIYCNTGYTPQPANTGFSVKVFCYPNATYYSNEFCGAQCPALPSIANGTLSPDSTASLVTVTVKCNDGCYMDGNAATTCSRGGEWGHNISQTTCSFAQCKEEDLKGRHVSRAIIYTTDHTDSPFSYGHNVTFAIKRPGPTLCYHFDNLLTNKNVTCQRNATWTTIPKVYQGTTCPIPSNTTTATHTSNGTALRCESTVNYTCTAHHMPAEGTDSLTLTCQVDGNWDRAPPNCETVFCDTPNLNVTHGEVRYQGPGTLPEVLLVNDTLHYDCEAMYRLVGDDKITCGKDGMWNGTVDSHCVLIVCPMAPITIPHGHRIDGIQNQTEYHLGDEVEYQCDSNLYELNYSDPISCNNTTTWNPYIPSCDLVTCDAPEHVEHSVPPTGAHPLYSNYTYTCEKGYRLSNNSYLTCNFSDGILGWQGWPPSCNMVYCGSVPNITNGHYAAPLNTSITQYRYNTQFNYTCYEGYNASVAYYTNCSQDSSWSPEPGCNPVRCRKPAVAYSVVNDSKTLYAYNDRVSVRCDDSRQYHPPQVLVCKNDGKWKVVSGDELISCHAEPVHSKDKKWTFVGVGLSMFVVLLLLLLLYGIKKRQGDREPFSGGKEFSVNRNPSYSSKRDNELTGFSNPTYEDEPRSFNSNSSSRLVLKQDDAGYTLTMPNNRLSGLSSSDSERTDSLPLQQYDTLHKLQNREKLDSISEPAEGQYNTLREIKSRPLSGPEEEEEDIDIYNVPTNRNSANASSAAVAASNQYHVSRGPSKAAPLIQLDEEDIYNVPTIKRNQLPPIHVPESEVNDLYSSAAAAKICGTLSLIEPRHSPNSFEVTESEVNDLYSSAAAAEICGTPIETDFDTIIYDNI